MKSNDRLLRPLTLLAIFMFTALTVRANPGIEAFEQGDYATARSLLQAHVDATPDDAAARLALARTLFQIEDAKGAATHVDRAAELDADNAQAHYWRGRIYGTLAANAGIFRAGGFAKVCRQSFERALEIDPNHRGALTGLIQFKLQAPKLVGGDKDEALALTDRLVALDPIEGTLQKADALRATKRDDEADAVMSTLEEQYPDEPRLRVRQGFAQQEDKNFDAAIAHFRVAAAAPVEGLSAGERSAVQMAWYQLGRSHVFAEKVSDDAVAAMQRYVAAESIESGLPGRDWAHFRLGQLLDLDGQESAATDHYQKAADLTNDKDLKRRVRQAMN